MMFEHVSEPVAHVSGRKIQIKNFKLDKNGKPVRSQRKKSVSQRIAEKKKPKTKFKRGTRS